MLLLDTPHRAPAASDPSEHAPAAVGTDLAATRPSAVHLVVTLLGRPEPSEGRRAVAAARAAGAGAVTVIAAVGRPSPALGLFAAAELHRPGSIAARWFVAQRRTAPVVRALRNAGFDACSEELTTRAVTARVRELCTAGALVPVVVEGVVTRRGAPVSHRLLRRSLARIGRAAGAATVVDG